MLVSITTTVSGSKNALITAAIFERRLAQRFLLVLGIGSFGEKNSFGIVEYIWRYFAKCTVTNIYSTVTEDDVGKVEMKFVSWCCD